MIEQQAWRVDLVEGVNAVRVLMAGELDLAAAPGFFVGDTQLVPLRAA